MKTDVGFVPEHYRAARRLHIENKLQEAEVGYLQALNQTPEDHLLLFFYGSLVMQTKRHGMALNLLIRSVELNQTLPEAYNNVGMCLKSMGRKAEALLAFERAIRIRPEADYWNNVASMAVNNAQAQVVINACDKALAMDPHQPQARWNRALALLELGQWAEGWDEYRWGYRAMGRANRQYDCAPWDGKDTGTLVVFGEQGVGDEIMFGETMRECVARCKQLIIDCHPRLVQMFQRSFPTAHVYGTRKQLEVEWYWRYERMDAKASIADLARLFRRTDGSFPGTPYIVTDMNRDSLAKAWLAGLPAGLRVGISWQGGTPTTHQELRSIAPPKLEPLLKVDGVTWVNLQYGDLTQKVSDAIWEDLGVHVHTNKPLIDDLDSLTSLAKMCDLVITVDQTLVWQCGAAGIPCWVMLPNQTSWRFPHRFGGRTPWFDSIRLFRQGHDNQWQPVIEEAAGCLRERIGYADQRQLQAAE